jgi:uncharacterized protein YxjI
MTNKQEPRLDTHSQLSDRFLHTENRYQTTQSTVLFVTSLQLSVIGNDFAIHRSNGDLYLRTEGKAFDLKSRIGFLDVDSGIVLHLRKEMLGPKARWIGENASGERLFKIERQLSCMSSELRTRV